MKNRVKKNPIRLAKVHEPRPGWNLNQDTVVLETNDPMSYLAVVENGVLDGLNCVGVRFNKVAKTLQIFNINEGLEVTDATLLEWSPSVSCINQVHANYRGEGKIPEVR
jgi:hypothetical protein